GRSTICSPITVTGGCRLYSLAACAAPATIADVGIAASAALLATSLTAFPARCAALVQSMLSLEDVNDAQENRLGCDLGVTAHTRRGRQRSAPSPSTLRGGPQAASTVRESRPY